MKTLIGMLVALALTGCYATLSEDGRGSGGAAFTLSLPDVLPPLIVLEPGYSVVGDIDEEVFYADGYYWARQDRSWYRTRDHHVGWSRIEDRHVPVRLAQSEPGRYRHYRGEGR